MSRMLDRDHGGLSYMRQDSPLTLADGLREYYACNAGRVLCPQRLPPDSAALFRSHDICHVIVGLDTTLQDEAVADLRTILSCDVGLRRYLGYLSRDRQAKVPFREIGVLRSLWVTVLAVPRICRAAMHALHIKSRWPWVPPDSSLSRALADLRREFGIEVP
jgi:hypothetical protein